MFAKTLVIFAAAAMTAAEARKLQVSPRDLIDIDFDNLDVRDIKDIVHEYKDQINDWAFEFGKNCPSEEVCERRSANWLRTEAFIQKFNADPSRSASVGHNRFSDLSKAEMDQILNARSVDENEDALRSRNLDDDSSADSDSDSDSEESFSDNDDDDNQERLLRGKPCKKNCEEPPTGCAA